MRLGATGECNSESVAGIPAVHGLLEPWPHVIFCCPDLTLLLSAVELASMCLHTTNPPSFKPHFRCSSPRRRRGSSTEDVGPGAAGTCHVGVAALAPVISKCVEAVMRPRRYGELRETRFPVSARPLQKPNASERFWDFRFEFEVFCP